jgi:hypothetical protein
VVSSAFQAVSAAILPLWTGTQEYAVAKIDVLVTVSIKYIMGMRATVVIRREDVP